MKVLCMGGPDNGTVLEIAGGLRSFARYDEHHEIHRYEIHRVEEVHGAAIRLAVCGMSIDSAIQLVIDHPNEHMIPLEVIETPSVRKGCAGEIPTGEPSPRP